MSGDVTSQQRDGSQQQRATDECRWIGRTEPVKETLDYSAGGEGPGQANRRADGDQFQPLVDHEPKHVDALNRQTQRRRFGISVSGSNDLAV